MLYKIRSVGRLIKWIAGSYYDFVRFFKYGGWRIDLDDKEQRNYYVVKVYHGLEKSLSFPNRSPNSGWDNARLLVDALNHAVINNNFGFHDVIGLQVLGAFVDENKDITNTDISSEVRKKYHHIKNHFPKASESISYGIRKEKFDGENDGTLEKPESFFLSRHSIREFRPEKVRKDILHHAIELSRKTPSACNRQPWHVYHITDTDKIQLALSHQSGNRGFGHLVHNLLVICSDIRAFNPGSERYQHWIDGGMYSMSLIYTLHSLGISSCCLNWSTQGNIDKKFRATFPEIDNSHTIIMMLAIGLAEHEQNICASPRKPMIEIYSEIK